MATYIVAKGANVNTADHEGRTVLMEAAKEGHAGVIQVLTKAKRPAANLNLQDKAGRTALMKAVARGDVQSVKALVAGGARIDIKDSKGETALSEANSLRQAGSMDKELDEIIRLLQPRKP